MLHELAIIPDVFSSSTDTKEGQAFLENFLTQIVKNCVLANLDDGKWVKFVMSLEMNENTRDKLRRYMMRMNDLHRIIECPPTFPNMLTDEDWLKLALSANEKRLFDGIVASERLWSISATKPNNLINYPPSLDNEDVWNTIIHKYSIRIKKDEEGFSKILYALLRYARSVWIIDPYINPRSETYRVTIELIAKFLGSFRSGKLGDYIEIQTSVNKGSKNIDFEKKAWTEFLKPLSTKHEVDFCIKFIGNNPKKQIAPHNRYLLTEQCGAIVPWGFDCYRSEGAGDDIWSLMDSETWSELRHEYILRPLHKVNTILSINHWQ